ncbi:unnamed protein product, partial [Tilletia caries]
RAAVRRPPQEADLAHTQLDRGGRGDARPARRHGARPQRAAALRSEFQILQHLPVQFRHVVRTQRTTSKWDDLRLSIYEEERALMREEEQDSKDRQDAAFAGFQSQQAPCGSKPGGAKSSPDSSN